MKQKQSSLSPAAQEGCRFCAIVRGEVQAYSIFEDEVSVAFLDHRPLFPGHCLLVSRDHCETLADLPARLIAPLFANAQLLARAVELGMQAEGTFIGVNNRISQSVPHFHLHIVPRRRKDGLRGFFWPRQRYPDTGAIVAVQAQLRSAISRLQEGGYPGFFHTERGGRTWLLYCTPPDGSR